MKAKDFPINCYTKEGIWIEELTKEINSEKRQLQIKEVMKRITHLKWAYNIDIDLIDLKLPYDQLIIFLDNLIHLQKTLNGG